MWPKLVITFVGGFLPFVAAAADQELTQKFRAALTDVNRIVLWETYPHDGASSGTVLEIKGSEVVASLGQVVEIDGRRDHCLCITSPEIRFYAGDQLRFTLTLHHATRLRDENGPWLGDVEMTTASSERFQDWFRAHGYDGFIKMRQAMELAQEKARQRWSEILALFPDAAEYITSRGEFSGRKETARRIEALRTKMPVAGPRILACWRALGRIEAWDEQNYSTRSLFEGALAEETTEDLRDAYISLLDSDGFGWNGVYHHRSAAARNDGALMRAIDEAGLVKLVRQQLSHGFDRYPVWTISLLKDTDGKKSRDLLVEIARGLHGNPKEKSTFLENSNVAMRLLAELHDSRAMEIADQRLRKPDVSKKEKLEMEIIRAQFDSSVVLGMEHLMEADEELVTVAWNARSGGWEDLSVEALLTLAKQDRRYALSGKAREILFNKGLRLVSVSEANEELWNKAYRSRVQTLEAIRIALAEVEAGTDYADAQRAFVLARLHYFEGLHLNRLGEYQRARSALILADRHEAAEQLTIACLGLGLIEESLGYIVRRNAFDEMLERRAYVDFARGNFGEAARDFEAAYRLNVTQTNAMLFAHLAYALAGKETNSSLPQWENPIRGISELLDEDGKPFIYWPETGILHLKKKMSWSDLESSVAAMHIDRAEAHFALSVICRLRGDNSGEASYVGRTLETKEFATYGYLLALARSRELTAESRTTFAVGSAPR